MSDSSDEGEPFRLRDLSEDSDDERPNKRRRTMAQPALRAKGLGFVSAAADDGDDDMDNDEDPEDERPAMGLGAGLGFPSGGFRGAFNIGEYSGEVPERSVSPEENSGNQTPNTSGRGPSAFGTNGKIQKSSFAARMMAKMGHVEGQGLGKAGQGISAPIQTQVLQNRAGLGHGTAPERHKKPKQDKAKGSRVSTPGTSTPRIKAPAKARYAITAIESRGLHVPEAMKSIIVDATGSETKVVSSVSGFSTPTSEGAPNETTKAISRVKMQLQAYADAWDATKETEVRLDQEEEQLQATIEMHVAEEQRFQDIISTFERVGFDDSNELREWDQVVERLQDVQDRFAEYIEDLDLPEMAVSCLEAPFRRQMVEWDPMLEPSHLVQSFKSLGAILEIEKAITSRHRKRTTVFETLLLLHWFPAIRTALKNWSVYEPDAAVDLLVAWQSILPPWLFCKALDEVILPKLLEAVRRFPKSIESSTHRSRSSTNGNTSSKSRRAPDLHSWLFDWWSIISTDDLSLARFPELRSLIKTKVDSESWPHWKPLLGSRSTTTKARPLHTSATTPSSLPTTPIAPASLADEEMTFKDDVEEWCTENDLLLFNTGKSDALGRLLYRLQDANPSMHTNKTKGRSRNGMLIYLQDDVVFSGEDGVPYGLDDSLMNKVRGG